MANVQELFELYRKLSPDEQRDFVAMLSLWVDLYLPDGDYVIIPKPEYARLLKFAQVIDHNALYELAKSINLEAGMPWTDPRTLETFKP
jgi:hypothetical protein